MKKAYLDLKKPSNRNKQNRGKGGRIVVMVINAGTTSLPDKLESGVDHTITIDGNGVATVMCQKWVRDNSDATPTKMPDGPPAQLNLTDADAQALQNAINQVIDPLVIAQFGVQAANVAPAVPATAALQVTITLDQPTDDGNGGKSYPITIGNGTSENTLELLYTTDGVNWTVFGTTSNVSDGLVPLDTPNPTGVTGSAQMQAVLTIGSGKFCSAPISVTF